MTTSEKIEKLNEACKGSLIIEYFPDGWNITTKIWTKLNGENITAPTFDAVVDKAFKFVFPLTVSKKKI